MLRNAHPDVPNTTVDAEVRSSWVIDVAARHARRQGVGVTIILPRAPGVVAGVREAAEACGVDVTTTIALDSVTARFQPRQVGNVLDATTSVAS